MIENYSAIAWNVLFLVLATASIYLALRFKYPGKIYFICDQVVELYNSVDNSLDNLRVTYEGLEVDSNLVLLKGTFLNVGKMDIPPDMVEKPLCLSLPSNYKWLSANIVFSDAESKINVQDDKTLILDFNLFRRGEIIRFHALAQLPSESAEFPSDSIFKDIHFDHRISNTAEIVKTNKNEVLESQEWFPVLGAAAFLILFSFGLWKLVTNSQYDIVFPYSVNSSVTECVAIKPEGAKYIKISSVQSEFEEIVSVNEFVGKSGPVMLIGEEFSYFKLAAFSFVLVMFLVVFWVNLRIMIKNRTAYVKYVRKNG